MKKGFTLLEVIIVVAIVASLLTFALPRIRKNNNNVKSVARELATLSKEIRQYARMKNSTYRIVFYVGGKEDGYYIEAANSNALALSEARQKILDSMPAEDRPKSPFQKVDKPVKGVKRLPEGLSFKRVETKSRKEPVERGVAYIHYTAEGLVEQSIVQITDGKNLNWSLAINPLTGFVDVYEREIRLKDLEVQ